MKPLHELAEQHAETRINGARKTTSEIRRDSFIAGARAMGERILGSAAEVQYIESGTFQGGEEDVFNAGIEYNEECLVVPAKIKAELAALGER